MNNFMLIGSQAIRHNHPDFYRECKDFDYAYFDKNDTSKSEKGKEYYYIPFLTFQEIIDMNELYTLKVSHSIRDINFGKHLRDICFLKSKGHVIIPDLLEILLQYWNSIHGIRRLPDFDKPNDEFFKDHIQREYNHDQLHELVKFGERPVFESVKYDLTLAKVEADLFNNLEFYEKINLVLEEAFVIALERYVFPKKCPYHIAFQNAMRDLITRLFPEWLAIWSLDNYQEIKNCLFDYTILVK